MFSRLAQLISGAAAPAGHQPSSSEHANAVRRNPVDVIENPTVEEAMLLTLAPFRDYSYLLSPLPLPADAAVKGNRVHNGDPSYGTVIHLGQTHCATGREPSVETEICARQSQHSILEALFKLQPEHIFADGLDVDFKTNENPDPQAGELRALFASWKPGKTTPAQEQVLGRAGAVRIYNALCKKTITVHKTTTPALNEETIAAQGDMEKFRTFMGHRNKFVTDELAQFFRANPGKTAVLVMGASHKLHRDCTADGFNPDFYYKDFSYLSAAKREAVNELLG